METKFFKSMTPVEQTNFAAALGQFMSDDLPALETTEAWGKEEYARCNRGLQLANAFAYARSFVSDVLAFSSHKRRLPRLRHYLERICQEVQVSANGSQTLPNTAADVRQTSPNAAKRGRPTLEEQAAAREEKKAKDKEAIANSLFPEEKPAQVQPMTFGGLVGNQDAEHISSSMPHLDQITWLLSEDLAADVANVRATRAEAASLAERAKLMAEMGKPASEVEPVATGAQSLIERVDNIYERVDAELAEVYVRCKYDPRYIERIENGSNITPADLRAMLKPYFSKQAEGFKERIIEKIHQESPELAAERAAAAEKKKSVDAIIKYLQRKDKPNTARRIATMEKKLAELTELVGAEQSEPYYQLLEHAKANPAPSRKAKDE